MEPLLILCPLASKPPRNPGAVAGKRPCATCGRALWVAPSTLAVLARPPADSRPLLQCPRCFARAESKLHAAGKEIAAVSSAQQEIEMLRATGRTMSEVMLAATGKAPKLIK